jgi:hypothetical protein
MRVSAAGKAGQPAYRPSVPKDISSVANMSMTGKNSNLPVVFASARWNSEALRQRRKLSWKALLRCGGHDIVTDYRSAIAPERVTGLRSRRSRISSARWSILPKVALLVRAKACLFDPASMRWPRRSWPAASKLCSGEGICLPLGTTPKASRKCGKERTVRTGPAPSRRANSLLMPS